MEDEKKGTPGGPNPFRKLTKKLQENRDSIHISRIPSKVREKFIDLAEEEFCGDYGMLLKWLMDDIVGQESKIIISKIEELESRIVALESNKEPVKEVKARRMCDGTERKVKRND